MRLGNQSWLIFFGLFFSLKAYAFEYKYSGAHQNLFNQKIYLFTKILKEIEFEPQFDSYFGDLPIIKADQVFKATQSRAVIFLKIGLEVEKNHQNQLIKLNDFYVYHFDDVALAFFHIEKDHAQILIDRINESIKQKMLSQSLIQIFNFKAEANSACEKANFSQGREFHQLVKVSNELSSLTFSKEFAQCAFDEIKESVANKVDIEFFFEKFRFTPAQMWEDIKKQYDGITLISSLFSKEFLNFASNLSINFSEDEKLKMTCLMGKAIGPSLPAMLIGPGAGLSFIKLFTSILPKFVKLSEMLLKLKKLPKSKNLVNAGLSCGI